MLPIESNSHSFLFKLYGCRISSAISFINLCCAGCSVAVKSVIHHVSAFSYAIESNCCDSQASEHDFLPRILRDKVDKDAPVAFAA